MRREGFGEGRGFGGGGGRDFQQKDAPVRVGEELDVTIEAVGAKGDGVAKKEGFVIFVPNSGKGDNVRIRITKVLNNMAFAEVAAGAGSSQGERPREAAPEERGESGDEGGGEGEAQTGQQPADTEDFGEEER